MIAMALAEGSSDLATRVAEKVKAKFLEENSGHDWHHINRVRKLAWQIAGQEWYCVFSPSLRIRMSSVMRCRNGLIGFWVSVACSCRKSRRDCLVSNIGSFLPLQTTYFPEHPSTVTHRPYRASV